MPTQRTIRGRAVPGRGERGRGKTAAWTQIHLWGGSPATPTADLVPTRPLLKSRGCERVLNTIRQVRTFFPELEDLSIRVGLTRSAAGFASYEEPWIWINPYRLRRHTIAHELIHLLQARGFVPSGERAADLHALARHPVLVDDIPCYLRVPASLKYCADDRSAQVYNVLWRTAVDAIQRRDQGHRTYLRWFERELAERWRRLEGEGSGPDGADSPGKRIRAHGRMRSRPASIQPGLFPSSR